jgi:hypothetical protein
MHQAMMNLRCTVNSRATIFRNWSSWTLSLSATVIVGLAGLSYVLRLFIYPSSLETLWWSFVDKRWVIALFALGVTLVYLPIGIKRIIDLLRDQNIPDVMLDRARIRKTHLFGRCAATLGIGFTLAAIHTGTYVPSALYRYMDMHELMHLGPLLSIAQGAIPYVGAQSQYGPGQQIVIFEFMHNIEFTVRGFRASFFLLNIVAETISFSLMFVRFGWATGLIGVALYFIFYSDEFMTFFGWFYLLRWLGPLVVGIILPAIVWSEIAILQRYFLITMLGIGSGTLGWISQENFSSALVTASLIVFGGFGRGRLSFTEAIYSFSTFAAVHILTFLMLLAVTVGFGNLAEALFLCFHTGSLVMRGVSNAPWSSISSPYTAAFYVTPYVVIAITGMALYSPQREPKDELRIGMILGMAAAVASLSPITLTRSDDYHFLGPSTGGLPALIALTVMFLPSVLTKIALWREVIRSAVMIIGCAIYLVPLGGQYLVARLSPDIREAWRGLTELEAILVGSSPVPSAAIFDQRLGWKPDADAKCDTNMSCRGLEAAIQRIRTKVGDRSVYVASPTIGSVLDSGIYFLADLNVGTSEPSILMSLFVRGDVERLKVSLAKKPPDCVMSVDRNGFQDLTKFLLRLYEIYTTDTVQDGFVFCRI